MQTLIAPLLCMLLCAYYGLTLSGKLQRRGTIWREQCDLLIALRAAVAQDGGQARTALTGFMASDAALQDTLRKTMTALTDNPAMNLQTAYTLAADGALRQVLNQEELADMARALAFEQELLRPGALQVLNAGIERAIRRRDTAEAKFVRDGKLLRSGGALLGVLLFILLI